MAKSIPVLRKRRGRPPTGQDPVTAVHDLIGVGNVVFSTDFPHPDCKYPGAVERFLELPLPDTAKRAILWDNCARYYGLAA